MKKTSIIILLISIITVSIIVFIVYVILTKNQQVNKKIESINENIIQTINTENEITEHISIKDINLHDIDGNNKNYVFTYKNIEYTATYTEDNWKIYDSYKITNSEDMEVICEALLNVHQIHSRDKQSYRTVQDLVNEWELHNVAYVVLSDESKYKELVKDVDFNPEDQEKDFEEMFKTRIK